MVKSVYIHIPFCDNICSYCDFCKMYYKEEWVSNYLISLEKEIKQNYRNEIISTIYIGGGTPSCLNENQLLKLFEIIKIFKTSNDLEYTIECNLDSLNCKKIELFKKYKINRVSIGIQTFNKKHLEFLNRKEGNSSTIIKQLKDAKIDNINVDLMYGFPNQTIEELKEDIKKIKELDVSHVSTYSLIIEPNTLLYIKRTSTIDEDLDYQMYQEILKGFNDYEHYEISNFSKNNCFSRHNLTYWNNEEYYGFGLGASGYLDNIRYDNTRSLNEYLNGKYLKNSETLTQETTIENEFILGLRKIKGINKSKFKEKYNLDIKTNKNILKMLKDGHLIDDGKNIFINEKYIYLSNEIFINLLN